MKLPQNHPLRFDLANEVHARPPEPLHAPVSASCIALTTNWPYRDEDRQIVCDLMKRYGVTPPAPGAKHFSADLRDFRLVWERHTEFTRYTIYVRTETGAPFARPAIEAAPADWIASLPGELIAAAHAAMIDSRPLEEDYVRIGESEFSGNALVGSQITGGAAVALTDFRQHADGFTRFLVLNRKMTAWHAGRIVQRLLEIETYRIMALLALPTAQALSPRLAGWEAELSEVAAAMTSETRVDETRLLERLTTLQAAIEKSHTESQFRFSAASAYYALVQRRIEELREERLPGMQTFQEFTERRLAPAMNTCMAASARQSALSERVDRSAQLLSTRVDMSLEQQNQQLLESMNRRAALQLRLQETVEGLSIAAITYYVVGVIGYMAKGLEKAGLAVNADVLTGASAPFVLAVVGFGLWRTRRTLVRRGEGRAPASPSEG